MEIGVVGAIAAIVAFVACLYEINIWDRQRRALMTEEQRKVEDNDALNMW